MPFLSSPSVSKKRLILCIEILLQKIKAGQNKMNTRFNLSFFFYAVRLVPVPDFFSGFPGR